MNITAKPLKTKSVRCDFCQRTDANVRTVENDESLQVVAVCPVHNVYSYKESATWQTR